MMIPLAHSALHSKPRKLMLLSPCWPKEGLPQSGRVPAISRFRFGTNDSVISLSGLRRVALRTRNRPAGRSRLDADRRYGEQRLAERCRVQSLALLEAAPRPSTQPLG